MATFLTNSLLWDTTSDRWLLNMSQNPLATDNLGIPVHPYVKKCYVSLEGIREHFQPLIEQNNATVNGEELKNYLTNNSQFVRVFEKTDLQIPTATSLGNELATKVTKDWYGEANSPTFVATTLNSIDENEASYDTIQVATTASGYLESRIPYLLRTDDTEHLSLEGWFYFKDEALVNQKFFTYDEAKKIKDMVEHRLEWMTKTDESTTFLSLSAGVASISPARKGNLPNSASVTGVCAGDILRVTVSGGSGEYSITLPSEFTEVGFNTYRFVENTAGTFSIVVTDINVNSTVTISIQTEEKV